MPYTNDDAYSEGWNDAMKEMESAEKEYVSQEETDECLEHLKKFMEAVKKENEQLKKKVDKLKEEIDMKQTVINLTQRQADDEHVRFLDERSRGSDRLCSISQELDIEYSGVDTDIIAKIKELKEGNKNVYNEDERGPWIKAKCNFSYVGEFLESRDICPWKTREDEAEEKFQFACEEIASVISSCINRTIKMGNCQELSDYITEEVNDMIDKLIETGHLVEGDEDSSDEEED